MAVLTLSDWAPQAIFLTLMGLFAAAILYDAWEHRDDD